MDCKEANTTQRAHQASVQLSGAVGGHEVAGLRREGAPRLLLLDHQYLSRTADTGGGRPRPRCRQDLHSLQENT